MTAGMVIAGAGECGTRAAFTLREAGYGGPVTLIGDEAHAPYERPPLSKAMLLDPAVEPKLIADEQRFVESGIDHRRGAWVSGIDRAQRTVSFRDGSSLPYEKLLLATGATSRRLPAGLDNEHIVYLRTLDEALRLRPRLKPGMRLTVLGAGFIGLELAATARTLGVEVTVVEAQPRILMRGVPEEIAAIIAERHLAEGVRILTGVSVTSIDAVGLPSTLRGGVGGGGRATPSVLIAQPPPSIPPLRGEGGDGADGSGFRLTLAGGETIEADLLIAAVGSAPVTGLATAAGLAVDNGIVVDEFLATADPHVFAAGDCCRFPLAIYGGRLVRLEAWRNAQELGAIAARNMLGRKLLADILPWNWSDQYDLTLQVAGLADEAVTTVRRIPDESALILFHLAADGRLVAASGIGRGNTVARDIKLAEMLIARGTKPDPAALAKPEIKLKSLLAA